VPLVHEGLGEGWDLVNLGHSGDTSAALIGHGHLEQAVDEIESRRKGDDPANDVKLVTLEIGGNDLLNMFLDLVLPGRRLSLTESPARPECAGPCESRWTGSGRTWRRRWTAHRGGPGAAKSW